jgi:glycerol-3-phosphate dehydrogenase (NAD(P)+)
MAAHNNGQRSARVAVLGDGGWGTALALLLHGNGHRVTVWGPFEDNVADVRARGENRLFLPGVPLPAAIRWTTDRREAARDAEVAVLAVPTRFFRNVARSFAGLLPTGCRLLSVAKGLDAGTRERMTQVAEQSLGSGPAAALSGPSHAEEVGRGIPTAVVLACRDHAVAVELQRLFANPRFRVYTSEDVAGVELGGALKNVIAIAVGVSDGLGFGDNTRAALITRGLAEITRLGCALGAGRATFAGLSGLGDLVVTCTSRHSRNRGVGERIGRGERVEDILAGMKQVAEGAWNCAIARDLARERRVSVPITDEVYAIVREGKPPREAVAALMTREMRPEDS